MCNNQGTQGRVRSEGPVGLEDPLVLERALGLEGPLGLERPLKAKLKEMTNHPANKHAKSTAYTQSPLLITTHARVTSTSAKTSCRYC